MPAATESKPTSTETDPKNKKRGKKHRRKSSGHSSGRSTGHTSSGSRRHKPKRSKDPSHFKDWPEEDQTKYHDLTVQLRRWKATQRQCLYLRRPMNQWSVLKSYFLTTPEYKSELEAYAQTKKAYTSVADGESFDLPPFSN